jgi:chromosome segregation ATPase
MQNETDYKNQPQDPAPRCCGIIDAIITDLATAQMELLNQIEPNWIYASKLIDQAKQLEKVRETAYKLREWGRSWANRAQLLEAQKLQLEATVHKLTRAAMDKMREAQNQRDEAEHDRDEAETQQKNYEIENAALKEQIEELKTEIERATDDAEGYRDMAQQKESDYREFIRNFG